MCREKAFFALETRLIIRETFKEKAKNAIAFKGQYEISMTLVRSNIRRPVCPSSFMFGPRSNLVVLLAPVNLT